MSPMSWLCQHMKRILSIVIAGGFFIACSDYRASGRDTPLPDTSSLEYCTYCHGTRGVSIAPPLDTQGNDSTTARGVGSHRRHVVEKNIDCITCHKVPANAADEGHMDSEPPAEVIFSGLATAHGTLPTVESNDGVVTCKNVYCHGAVLAGGNATVPKWNGTKEELEVFGSCGACHGLPPDTGKHWIHSVLRIECVSCHNTVYQDDKVVLSELHVNGRKDVSFTVGSYNSYSKRCSGVCHEDRSWSD